MYDERTGGLDRTPPQRFTAKDFHRGLVWSEFVPICVLRVRFVGAIQLDRTRVMTIRMEGEGYAKSKTNGGRGSDMRVNRGAKNWRSPNENNVLTPYRRELNESFLRKVISMWL